MKRIQAGVVTLVVVVLAAAAAGQAGATVEEEKAAVAKAIDASIGWFATKDVDLLLRTMAQDPDFFVLNPDTAKTVRGIEEFKKRIPFWMSPDVRYLRHEIRDLDIHLSRGGDVAWYSAILDDCLEFQGKPSCAWTDVRWTGVLEKREGRWVIVQMHFSFDADKMKCKESPQPKS